MCLAVSAAADTECEIDRALDATRAATIGLAVATAFDV
jgi:hypothetical protein